MTATPLIEIPEERKQQELRRAIAAADAEHRIGRRVRLVVVLCLVWALLGFALLGLGFHLTDPDRAQAALLLAFLAGYGGPAWTVIFAHWSVDRS